MLRDVVRDRLRDVIMDGTLSPGERLNNSDLHDWRAIEHRQRESQKVEPRLAGSEPQLTASDANL